MGEIEDGLEELLKFASFGQQASPSQLLHMMFKSMELSALKQLKSTIDTRIKEISKEELSREKGTLNPFTILGVSIDSTDNEVRKAYKKKATTAHPDMGGSNEEMKKVNAAWEAIRRVKGWTK